MNEDDLYDALSSGALSSAALDVLAALPLLFVAAIVGRDFSYCVGTVSFALVTSFPSRHGTKAICFLLPPPREIGMFIPK